MEVYSNQFHGAVNLLRRHNKLFFKIATDVIFLTCKKVNCHMRIDELPHIKSNRGK